MKPSHEKNVWKVQIVLIYFNGTTHVMNIMSFQLVFLDLGMPWRPGICTWISWTSSSTFFSCWVKGDSWVWRKSPTSCTGCTGMDVEKCQRSRLGRSSLDGWMSSDWKKCHVNWDRWNLWGSKKWTHLESKFYHVSFVVDVQFKTTFCACLVWGTSHHCHCSS